MKYPQGRIILFAKSPSADDVKTRLRTVLTPRQATALYHTMLMQTLACAVVSDLCPVEIHWSQQPTDDDLLQYCQQHQISSYLQQGDDLGQRLTFALQSALQHSDYAIVIGTDCPLMSADYLTMALTALAKKTNVVIGPAEDGGYVLIGMDQVYADLFTNIPWSTDQVLVTTQQRIADLHLSSHNLTMLWDVDDPKDLLRLTKEYAQYSQIIKIH